MKRNKKHFIIWKLMLLIPMVLGIFIIFVGWIMREMGYVMGSILIYGGIISMVTCVGIILFARYNPNIDWVARSVGGKL